MNFTAQIVIERPREYVIALLRDPANLPVWQPDWRYGPLLTGEQDRVGAQRRVFFQVQSFQIEMVETIVAFSPPTLISSVYTARGVRNLVENRFFADTPASTRWVINNSVHFNGLMVFVGTIVSDLVPKQTVAAMQRFKQLAEGN